MNIKKRLFFCIVLLLTLCCLLAGCITGGSTTDTPAAPAPEGSTLQVHFIDVGQADATLLLCGGQAMLIDGGNVDDSSTIVTYLKKYDIDYLDYVVCTHAHEDHVGGLSGALNHAEAGRVFCPVTEYDSAAFENFVKYTEAQGLSPECPEVGSTLTLGDATLQFLAPLRDYEETNDTSIAVRVTYGKTSFLFTGDAEREAEQDMVDSGYDLSATVLQVGHHGSDSSSSYVFLREVMPQYAVISVGADNSYGHPTEEALSRLRDAGAAVYRTDLQGDIICTSDGEEVSFTTARGEGAETNPTAPPPAAEEDSNTYIGNAKSMKYHRESCANLPAEENRVYLTRSEAQQQGYTPCGNCNP